MAEERHIGSILLADCGTATTKVVLLEQVGGQYRLVAQAQAPTTSEFPWSDVSEGIHHAVDQISEVTGRTFFGQGNDLITPELGGRQGVDAFAATASASPPLEVVLGGLVRDLSIASAERAAAGTYSLVKAILAGDGRGGMGEVEHVRKIRRAAPDVICITGGTDGGASTPVVEMTRTVVLACSMMDPTMRPRLLYAGNSQLRRRIVNLVKGQTEIRMADNVRPTLTEENLPPAQAELDAFYMEKKMGLLPGIEVVSSWSSIPIAPSGRAFGRLIQYLYHLGDQSKGVIGVDVGAANTTVAAVFGGQLFLTIYGGLGSAFGGQQLLQRQGAEAVTRWLPGLMSGDEVRGVLINKEMHPASIYQDHGEMWVEHAMAREVMRAALAIARPGWEPGDAAPYPDLLPLCDTIIVGGGTLAYTPRPGQAALAVLDALQPFGVSTLVLDVYGLAPVLGNVAAVKPLAAVETLDSGAFVNLATTVSPVGRARLGEVVLKVKVTYDDSSVYETAVRYGDLEMLPLQPGREALVQLNPARRFDIGLGGPGKGGQLRVSGGLAGLILDARGRPLHLSGQAGLRRSLTRRWLWQVGG